MRNTRMSYSGGEALDRAWTTSEVIKCCDMIGDQARMAKTMSTNIKLRGINNNQPNTDNRTILKSSIRTGNIEPKFE